MLNVSIPLCIRKCSHQNTFQWNNLLFHGIDTCNSRHPKFSRYSPVNREIKSTFNWHRHKQSDHSTYRHAFAFIFDIYADAHTLGLIISLESRTIALFLPTITFTSCMFFHFDQFFVQQFHFTALVLWFVDLSTANNNRNKKSDLCFEIYISKTLISTSNTMLFVSNGWHERRLLVQHPPHRLTRVQGGKTRMVGSFASDPSANFNGTTVISGTQLAGVAILPADRSTASPPKRAATNQIESINSHFNHLFSFRKLLWFNSGPFQQYGSQRRALFIHGNMPQPKWIFPIQFGIECGTRLVWPYNQRQWMYWTLSSVWCLATIWAELCRSCDMWTDWNETNTWTSVSSMNSNLKRISCINNCLSFLERRRRLKMPLCVHQHRQTFHQLQDMKVRRHQNGILKSRRLCIATKNTKDE